jgi:hypothetical protein
MTTPVIAEFTDDQRRTLGYWSNTVRPPRSARRLDARTFVSECKSVEVTLHEGHASDGYKSDFRRVVKWWVVISITDHATTYRRGRRFSSVAKARAYYGEVT